jgi:hypothetical protein
MFRNRITQIAFGLIFSLSLFASSISACTCPQHEHSEQVETHSHHSHQLGSEHHEHVAESSTSSADSVAGSECCCVQPAPKVVAKSETVRPDGKNVASTSPIPEISFEFVQAAQGQPTNFRSRTLVTDPHYNTSPGRAPPRL